MQSNGIPMFATGPVRYNKAISWLIGRHHKSVTAVEKHFPGVRVRTGRFEPGDLFYVEPRYKCGAKLKEVLDQCRKCQLFLESYIGKAKTSSGRLTAKDFLDSEEWALEEKRGKNPESYHQAEMSKSKKERDDQASKKGIMRLKGSSNANALPKTTSRTKPENSKGKRKTRNSALETPQLPGNAKAKRARRTGSGGSSELIVGKEPQNLPLYGVLIKNHDLQAIEVMFRNKQEVEYHLQIQFRIAYSEGQHIVYCKSNKNIALEDGISHCKSAYQFLCEFLDGVATKPMSIESYYFSRHR